MSPAPTWSFSAILQSESGIRITDVKTEVNHTEEGSSQCTAAKDRVGLGALGSDSRKLGLSISQLQRTNPGTEIFSIVGLLGSA